MAASLKPALAAMGARVAQEVLVAQAVTAGPARGALVVQAAMEEGRTEAQAGLVGPGLAAMGVQAAMGVALAGAHVPTGDQVSWGQQQQLRQLRGHCRARALQVVQQV
jgi:hypothetical protein